MNEHTLIPDSLTGQWQTDPLSDAAARGAARSELFRATPDRTPRGEQNLWLSLPHRPREVNRRVASPVGPAKLFAPLPPPPLPLRGRQASTVFSLEATAAVPCAQRKRRGGCTRGSPQTGDALGFACRARLGEWLRRADRLSAVASSGCGRTVLATPVALPARPRKVSCASDGVRT